MASALRRGLPWLLFFALDTLDTGGRASDGGRATLLLLDRADDTLSPLMHEFTYQCLVEDLLGIQVTRRLRFVVDGCSGGARNVAC